MKPKAETIARTVVLFLALINQFLVMTGKNPIPYADSEIYEFISYMFTGVAAIISWWKNNSFTPAALEADEVMKKLKSKVSEENADECN